MAVAAAANVTQVQALSALLQGQLASLGNLETTVSGLQASVGGLTSSMADMGKKLDLLINGMSNGNKGAKGVGRDGGRAKGADDDDQEQQRRANSRSDKGRRIAEDAAAMPEPAAAD